MFFPFNVEGEVVIEIDAPAKAGEIRAGIERWLAKSGAHGLQWDEDRLRFSGISAWAMGYRYSRLRGIGDGEIRIRSEGHRLVIRFSWSRSDFHFWFIVLVGMLPGTAVGLHSLPLALCVLPVFIAINYAVFAASAYDFRSDLRLVAIRAQADHAAAELAELRSRSQALREVVA